MGLYINPTDRTKEQWLAEHGKRITEGQARLHDYRGKTLPVCLMQDVGYTAAAIGTDKAETRRFVEGRQSRECTWWEVPKADLSPWTGQGES